MGTVARLDMLLRANATQARNEFRSLRAEFMLSQQALQNLTLMGSNMFGTLKTIAKYSVLAFGAVSIASAASIAVVKEYDKNLTHAAAIANLTKSEMNELGKQINLMSLQFGQSANDISAGVVELTKAGLGMGDISLYMDDITKAMMANSITFADASKIAIYAAKQFGGPQGFGAIPELLDMVQKVTQETIMDFGDLQQALAYAGSTATLARVDFAELLSMMGALSQRAMEMGIASRSVNQMMMNLIDKADEMQAWVDTMGLGVQVIKDGSLNITELIQKFSTLDMTMEMLQKSSDIFTVRAMRSWGLLVTGADEYVKLLNEDIPNSVGVLDQVFQKQQETIEYHLGQLGNIMTAPFRNQEYIGMIIEMLEKLEEPVKRLSQVLYTGMYKFMSWTVENADEIVDFFSDLLTFVFKLVEPFYNIGKWVTRLSEGMLKFLIYTKMLMSLGMLKYMQFSMSLMKQNVQLRLQEAQIMGTTIAQSGTRLTLLGAELEIAVTKASLDKLQSAEKRNQLAILRTQLSLLQQQVEYENMKMNIAQKSTQQELIKTGIMRNQAMIVASIAASAAMGAFASYAMAEAMGATTGDYARNILMGAATGAMMGGMVGGIGGAVAGGLIGGVASGIGTYAGDQMHTPFEPTVDLGNLESMFSNMDYSATAYTPTDLTQGSTGSSEGGFGGGGGDTYITVEGNVYGDQALDRAVRGVIDGY